MRSERRGRGRAGVHYFLVRLQDAELPLLIPSTPPVSSDKPISELQASISAWALCMIIKAHSGI